MKVTIIGLGEAGPVFAQVFLNKGFSVTAWDTLQNNSVTADQQIKKTQLLGIAPGKSMHDAVHSADLIVSTVTASHALSAAQQAAEGLRQGCHWLDLNSVSPATKLAIHEVMIRNGALFTEGVAMDTIVSKGLAVPLLLCGPESQSLSEKLNRLGFNTRSVSPTLGAASTTKLLRSILIKGMEALFAESMEAASKVDVANEVVASLQATYPEMDWQQVAGYQLSRATLHAARRAEEMREAGQLVAQLGVEPIMATAIARRQQNLSDRDIAASFKNTTVPKIADFIHAISKSSQQ